MAADHSSGDDAHCEPNDAGPYGEPAVPSIPFPAVTSAASQLIGKSWMAEPAALRSAASALMPSASKAASAMAELIGGPDWGKPGSRFDLTDLSRQAGRVWDELHPARQLAPLWAQHPGPQWRAAHPGNGWGAELAAEAAARLKAAMPDMNSVMAGVRADSLFARAMTPRWEALQSGPSAALAKSFLPARPDLSAMSGFASGLAVKALAGPGLGAFAGLDPGSPSRFVVAEHLTFAGPPFAHATMRLGASVFDNVTAAAHRHAQGLAEWMQTTHRVAMDAVWRAPHESIASMLRNFTTLADQGVAWGWRGLWTALQARRAVLRGDAGAVIRFLKEVLGFQRTPPTLVDAASAVLLEEAAWMPADWEVDDAVCPRIRQLTIREHRNFRLIGDTKLCGRPVDSLDREVTISRSEVARVPLVEVLPAPRPTAGMDDITDPRLLKIFGQLTERERAILRVRAEDARNWADTAVSCGATRTEVENLRRKLKRLSKFTDSTVAATAVS